MKRELFKKFRDTSCEGQRNATAAGLFKLEKIKIAFLFDSSNNWIERYVRPIACNNSLAMRYSFFFSYFPDEIINFDVVFILGYTKILKVDFLKNNR
ncbi:MAG TPA: hypothetical protein PLU82_01370, partial [Oscillospiraceae bacterium]|nr:hypothetical protein [Oscillospiraceae bacterium]